MRKTLLVLCVLVLLLVAVSLVFAADAETAVSIDGPGESLDNLIIARGGDACPLGPPCGPPGWSGKKG